MRVNRRGLADILGVTLPTITAWIDKDGLPYTRQGSKGVEWEFETAEVVEWYAAHKFQKRDKRSKTKASDDPFAMPDDEDAIESEDQAKARKERALADIQEMKAAREAGLLVPIDEVDAIVVEENARVRTRILGIPTKIRPQAIVLTGNDRDAAEKIVATVESEILSALLEIKSWAPTLAEDDGQ